MTVSSLQWSTNERLWTRWLRHAERTPDAEAIAVLRAGAPAHRWSWGALVQRAEAYAAELRDRGVAPGQTCAIIVRHHPDFYPLYMGVSALGAIPAVLAYPNTRLHPDKFRAGLAGMARESGLDWVLTETELVPSIAPLVTGGQTSIRGVLTPLDAPSSVRSRGLPVEGPVGDVPALVQHSSGTTGLQKAVALSHRAILEHVRRYGQSLGIGPDDRVVSWLPLYHDMGLIAAFHMPLALGVPTVHIDPFEWVVAPILLIDALHHERGTLCWQPNFAFALMGARLHDDELTEYTLAHVRAIISCSEPVRADSFETFLRKLAPCGLGAHQLGASYAMAEATFAVTQTRIGASPRVLQLDREALAKGRATDTKTASAARTAVSSGGLVDGCALRAVDASGRELGEDQVGELVLRSASLFDGYRNRPDLTAECMCDGWYHTGDFGFVRDGEWYVVGRKKDIIIVAGKNLYPEDIEAAVADVAGVIPGRVVAFGVEDPATGTERVCLAAETELEAMEHDALRARLELAVRNLDVTLSDVYLVPPRWLVKSSAGKLSRSANRARLIQLSPAEGSTP